MDLECYRAARKLRIQRAKDTLWEIVADLQVWGMLASPTNSPTFRLRGQGRLDDVVQMLA